MRIAVVSWTPRMAVRELKKAGLAVVARRPDIVLAFGGDGTFLYSEQKYPGVPKLFVRHDRNCVRPHDFSKLLEALSSKQYSVEVFPKLEATVGKRKLVALGDLNLHYVPPCALRFAVKIGSRVLADNAIGDGLVMSTPYGSTGYYKSITRGSFAHNFGLAFNNCTQPMKTVSVPEDVTVTVGIARGPGVLAADCNKKTVALKDGDVIKIRKHDGVAKIIRLKGRPLKVEKFS